jgi:hypothetical protein
MRGGCFIIITLLAYNSCTGGYIVRFIYVFKTYLVGFPPIVIPLPPSPFLQQFQQVSFFCFHIWIQNKSTMYTFISLFLVPTSLPLVPSSRKDLPFSPALHLFF